MEYKINKIGGSMYRTKAILALFVLGTSMSSAGTMGEIRCVSGNVTSPCSAPGWMVGGKALYLQSATGIFDFPGYTTSGNVNTYRHTGNQWHWGFELEASYQNGQGRDFHLSWDDLTSTKNLTVPGPIFGSSGTVHGGPFVYMQRKPIWDAVNLEVGQSISLTDNSSLRFHGGGEYVYLGDKTNRSSTSTTPTQSVQFYRNITYSAGGPRVGADLYYKMGESFSLYAKGAVGVYAGRSNMTVQTTSLTSSTINQGSAVLITPEVEGKLGASYGYTMAKGGSLSVDAGWMMINYVGALMATYGNVMRSENFALQGLFFGLKWSGPSL